MSYYIFIGSGLFNATIIHQLVKQAKTCLVLDKRPHLGGNVYTETVADINVHAYGAHIFHTNDRDIWDFVNRFAEFNHYINSPIVNYRGKLYNLPFNMNTFHQIWQDVITPGDAGRRIETQSLEMAGRRPGEEPRNLEEQAISLVGRDIYEILIKGYTEKQWGRPCSELPAAIIKRLPVRFIFDNNYFNDRYQGIPIGGYTPMIEKMLAGAELRLDTDFFADRQRWMDAADRIIFTGRIDEFFDYRFGELEYRSLRFEHEILDCENYQGNAVVNYTDAAVPYTRIIEHKHFEFGAQPKTVITREYPQPWVRGEEPYYPVNDEKNNALYQKYKALADRQDKVIFGGRLGMYRYFDMDDTIAAALRLADELLGE